MKLYKEKIKTELNFEKDEAMSLLVSLSMLLDFDEDNFDTKHKIYQLSIFYLAEKLGATLSTQETEAIKSFSKKIKGQ